MPRKRMWVEWEDGAELSRSHKKPGSSSPLTRDADGQLGQVTLDELEDDDEAAGHRAAGPTRESSFASQLASDVAAEVKRPGFGDCSVHWVTGSGAGVV